jgi:hypothetical protein
VAVLHVYTDIETIALTDNVQMSLNRVVKIRPRLLGGLLALGVVLAVAALAIR